MRELDLDAFKGKIAECDDATRRHTIEEYGISSVPKESFGVIDLFRPFLDFTKAEKPEETDVSVEDLCRMADSLDELVSIFTDADSICGDTAARNLRSLKGLRRRRVL